MRIGLAALALGVLGACAPAIPDSGAGVGFDNSISAQRAREAALAQQGAQPALPPASAISDEALPPGPGIRRPVETTASALPPVATVSSAPIATVPTAQPATNDAILDAAASLDETQANSGVPPVQASPSNPPPALLGNPGLSDENDFAAVSERESIQSDAQRIQQNRAQYQQVQPTELPSRAGDSQPNIVQYALDTRHAKGTRIYSRAGINLAARAQRNCSGYASADQAQIDFLARGGPRRDRKGLDPDGDGYACSWDPAPFRAAVGN